MKPRKWDRYISLATWPGRVVRASDGYWNATRFCQVNEKSIEAYINAGEYPRAVMFCRVHGVRRYRYIVLDQGGNEITTEEFLAEYAAAHAIPITQVVQLDTAGEVWFPWPIMLDVGSWCSWRYGYYVQSTRIALALKAQGLSKDQIIRKIREVETPLFKELLGGGILRTDRD